MTSSSGDPHAIEDDLESTDEYQAPPRGKEHADEPELSSSGDDQPIDINLLESQTQKPGLQISETIVSDPSQIRGTISGPDEESHPDNPDAVPPGETM